MQILGKCKFNTLPHYHFLSLSCLTNHITVTNIIRTSVPYNTISLMNDTTFLVNTIEDRRPLRTMTMSGEEKDMDLVTIIVLTYITMIHWYLQINLITQRICMITRKHVL